MLQSTAPGRGGGLTNAIPPSGHKIMFSAFPPTERHASPWPELVHQDNVAKSGQVFRDDPVDLPVPPLVASIKNRGGHQPRPVQPHVDAEETKQEDGTAKDHGRSIAWRGKSTGCLRFDLLVLVLVIVLVTDCFRFDYEHDTNENERKTKTLTPALSLGRERG